MPFGDAYTGGAAAPLDLSFDVTYASMPTPAGKAPAPLSSTPSYAKDGRRRSPARRTPRADYEHHHGYGLSAGDDGSELDSDFIGYGGSLASSTGNHRALADTPLGGGGARRTTRREEGRNILTSPIRPSRANRSHVSIGTRTLDAIDLSAMTVGTDEVVRPDARGGDRKGRGRDSRYAHDANGHIGAEDDGYLTEDGGWVRSRFARTAGDRVVRMDSDGHRRGTAMLSPPRPHSAQGMQIPSRHAADGHSVRGDRHRSQVSSRPLPHVRAPSNAVLSPESPSPAPSLSGGARVRSARPPSMVDDHRQLRAAHQHHHLAHSSSWVGSGFGSMAADLRTQIRDERTRLESVGRNVSGGSAETGSTPVSVPSSGRTKVADENDYVTDARLAGYSPAEDRDKLKRAPLADLLNRLAGGNGKAASNTMGTGKGLNFERTKSAKAARVAAADGTHHQKNDGGLVLPDVTGVSSALDSPDRMRDGVHHWRVHLADKGRRDDEARADYPAALSELKMRLGALERETLVSNERIVELEEELDACRHQVERERQRAAAEINAEGVHQGGIAALSELKMRLLSLERETVASNARIVELEEELDACRRQVERERRRAAVNVDEEDVRRRADAREAREMEAEQSRVKQAEVVRLRTEVARLAVEIDKLKLTVEMSLQEREKAQERARVFADHYEGRREIAVEQMEQRREANGPASSAYVPAAQRREPRLEQERFSRRVDKGVQAAQRPARSRQTTNGSGWRPTVEEVDDRLASAQESERMAKVFAKVRVKDHDEQTCSVCHRKKRKPADVSVAGDTPARHGRTKEDPGPRVDAEGAARRGGTTGTPLAEVPRVVEEGLPPQTTLARVLQELEDDFAHSRMLYIELADEYKRMDPAMNAAKRRILAQHLIEVIEELEQKADQIAGLYDLLKYEEMSATAPKQDFGPHAADALARARSATARKDRARKTGAAAMAA